MDLKDYLQGKLPKNFDDAGSVTRSFDPVKQEILVTYEWRDVKITFRVSEAISF